jgi:hypothetical protein
MKVGLSLSRCVRDIYQEKVDINDVMIVIARTDFDPEDDEQWTSIWNGYGGGQTMGSPWSNPEWSNIPPQDEQKVRDICIELKRTGRLHQPRQYGAHPSRLPYIWLDTFAPMEEIANNPATVKAWENYKMLAGLSNKEKSKVKDNF